MVLQVGKGMGVIAFLNEEYHMKLSSVPHFRFFVSCPSTDLFSNALPSTSVSFRTACELASCSVTVFDRKSVMALSRFPTSQVGVRRLLLCQQYRQSTASLNSFRPWSVLNDQRIPSIRHSSSLTSGPPVPGKPSWIESLPSRARPYLYLTRIDKPIGTMLLFWPCSTSLITPTHISTHSERRALQHGQLPWLRMPCISRQAFP
jgi:hypothetical protein